MTIMHNQTTSQKINNFKDYQSPQDYFLEYDGALKNNAENEPEFKTKFSLKISMRHLAEAISIIKELEKDRDKVLKILNLPSSYKTKEFYRDNQKKL